MTKKANRITIQSKDKQAHGQTDLGDELGLVTKFVCIIAPIECYTGYRYFRE